MAFSLDRVPHCHASSFHDRLVYLSVRKPSPASDIPSNGRGIWLVADESFDDADEGRICVRIVCCTADTCRHMLSW